MEAARLSRPARRRFTRPVPVSVNGVVIAGAEIARETQHHASADPDRSWELAAQALTIRELLRQEADRLGIEAEPIDDGEGRRETPEEARLRALIDREVSAPQAGEATCRCYYEANRRRFRSPTLFEAAHILIAATPTDIAARDLARRTAAMLIDELRHRPEAFASLCAQHSSCPSREHGGNLGQVGPGQTVADFERALQDMTPGIVHPQPVETRFGFHVVRLDRRIDGRQLPFEAVSERIAQYLDEAVHRRALGQYVRVLAAGAELAGVDLSASPGSPG